MIDCYPFSIPLRKPETGTEIGNLNGYQFMIGSLVYAVIGTRPDIAHAETVPIQSSSSLNEPHLQATKAPYDPSREPWIGSFSPPEAQDTSNTMDLMCYSDASYASSHDD